MIRNIFSRRPPAEKGATDDFDRVISRIERFAPKQYRAERDSHYYNYRILHPYVRPLLGLLTEISDHSRVNEEAVLRVLFEKLKGFYDTKDSLSLEEASKDPGLRRKFVKMLLYFYDEKEPRGIDLKRFFGEIIPGREQPSEGHE